MVGTYGRGAFIADISLLRQLKAEVFEDDHYLFEVEAKPQRNMSERAWWGNYEMLGDNYLSSKNEPNELSIYYYFRNEADTGIIMDLTDMDGTVIDTLDIIHSSGIHKTTYPTWELEPDNYKVRLNTGTSILERKAVIKEPPVWPVGHGMR